MSNSDNLSMEQLKRQSAPSTGDKERRRFKCGRCDKRFRRSEHCARHELMHTEERPFICRYCSKRYGRKDLLRRHERTIHAEEHKSDISRADGRNPPPTNNAEKGDMAVEDEPLRASSNSAAGDELPETPQTMEDAGNVDPGYIGEPTGPVINPTSPSAHLEQNAISPGMQALHSLESNPYNPLDIGPASEPSFFQPLGFHPLTASHLLPSVTFPIQPDLEILVGRSVKENEGRGGLGHLHLNGRRQGSLPLSPPSDRLPSDGSVSQGFGFCLTPTRHAPPVPGLDEYNIDPLELGIDLAQRPLDAWSQNPDNITLHLPVIMRELPGHSVRNILSHESFMHIHNDISQLGLLVPHHPLVNFEELQQFTNSYVGSFHPHLPFIHLVSLSSTNTPTPLVLAMASIGALYRLQRRRAYELYELTSKIMSSGDFEKTKMGGREPLWLLQTNLLLTMFGTFSSKPDLAGDRFKKMGCLMMEYHWRRIDVQNKVAHRNKLTWAEWVEIEETKRTLCAMFIFSSMLLIAFNITPGYVIERDLLIDIPDHESLWAASSAQEWDNLRGSLSLRDTTGQTLQSAVELMIHPPGDETELEDLGRLRGTDSVSSHSMALSGFTALVVMHGVNIYLWQLNQLTQAVSRVSLGIWPQENLRTALLHAASMTVERCQAALLESRVDDSRMDLYDPEHIHIFNCGAVLRVACSRLLPLSHSFNRLVLLTKDQKVIARAVKMYARQPLQRTVFVTKAAKMAYNGFLGPVKIGALLVSKTAALSWSVEQAIAGWDSALLLSKWVHGLEMADSDSPPDSDEAQIFNDLKSLLSEIDVGWPHYDRNHSLAAMLAKVWASFLDDTWVWGVTPNMSSILRLLSNEYQERFIEAVPLC